MSHITVSWGVLSCIAVHDTNILEELAGPIFRLPLREFYFW